MQYFRILRVVSVIIILGVASCGPESSPEGRMSGKLDGIQKQLDSLNNLSTLQIQIDSLKSENASIKDSIRTLKMDVEQLKQ